MGLSFPKIASGRIPGRISASSGAMLAILHLLGMFVVNRFRSRRQLEAENVFLRHQLSIALRRAPRRLRLHGSDRAVMVWMTRVWPSVLGLSRGFSLTRSCGGIEQGFGPIGAGNLAPWEAGRKSMRICARLSGG